ncbi:MAG: radical SAM protein, partial [Thermodesulfobacteriota bacterium]|nr:radical SAM protein [Thermodesulfobacteriota bacterium]
MAKVLLLNPPHPKGKGFTREGRCTQEAGVWATQWPPVSLTTTAAFLERDGHVVKVFDCPAVGLDRARLEVLTKRFQPDFAFWTTATPTLNDDLNLAGFIKKNVPAAVTGVFGTHVTALPEVALTNPSIDVVIRREPEQTIREICLQDPDDWEGIDGISFRDRETGRPRHNLDRALLRPEDIPSPAWRYLDITPYRLPLKGRPFLIVAPIRGCPYACNFCTAPLYYGKKLRKRPVRTIVDEIESNIKRFKVKDFFIWADTFTADRGYVKEFSREITTRGLKISWTCNSRVDTVDREMISLMKEAGLWMISFGLESGNNEVLEQTGKKITVEQSKVAVSIAHEFGIKTSGHFVLGLPGETEASMRDTLTLALDLPLDIAQFYAAAPFPGTSLYDLASKKGWIEPDFLFSQDHAAMDLPGLPGQRVDAFRRYAYRRFYGRPKAIRK